MPAIARSDGSNRFDLLPVVGAVGSLAVALILFTRFTLYSALGRDEGIYAYGGIRMVHGVPPYSSIFDPKTPVATLVCGIAAWFGHLTGHNQLTTIRLAFLVIALATV